MARIILASDAGDWIALNERVTASDLASSHFAKQLVQRLAWAAEDIERGGRPSVESPRAEEIIPLASDGSQTADAPLPQLV